MPNPSNGDAAFFEIHSAINSCDNVEDALAAFCRHYETPFVTYHFANAIKPGYDAPFVRTSYPDKWVARYLLKDYVKTDPVVREGFQRMLPFEWSEVDLDETAMELMKDAMTHGISIMGFSIPLVDRSGRRALLSINAAGDETGWPARLANHRKQWCELAHLIHQKAILEIFDQPDPQPKLGPRELECLHWSARGKDGMAIAILLGLSEHTVRSYLKSARFKLGSCSVAQAVSVAMKLGAINP